jgi:hypothetical protein
MKRALATPSAFCERGKSLKINVLSEITRGISDVISKFRLPIQTLAVLLCATTASAQENRGTPEQRAACAPDAFRFCVGYLPDPTGVEYCLRQNMSDLSGACRSVFEQSASLLTSKAPREPGRPTRSATSAEAN